jgi:hypothetical protein
MESIGVEVAYADKLTARLLSRISAVFQEKQDQDAGGSQFCRP